MSEILNMPISLLRQLRSAKIKEKELMLKSRSKGIQPYQSYASGAGIGGPKRK